MKKVLVVVSSILLVLILVLGVTQKEVNYDYLRVHIRANSNSEKDQLIKYKIKDSVITYLTPYIANCNSFDEVKICLNNNLLNIDTVANNILKQNGFNYTAKSKINEEAFPTRVYGEFVLESGYYDALIIELGNASGDNWWCVVYPPLCFTNAGSGSNVKYKSRILEMIKNFRK